MQRTPVMSPRQVITDVDIVEHYPPPPSPPVEIEPRRPSVNNLGDLVMRIMQNNRAKRGKPKELSGKWMPHSHPVRKINTSTK